MLVFTVSVFSPIVFRTIPSCSPTTEYADGTRERGMVGHDGIGVAGNVVTARSGIVAHGNDDRILAFVSSSSCQMISEACALPPAS